MTYSEQLKSPNWKTKRQEILLRDNQKCQHCYNERILIEMEDGLFNRYLFPNDKCAINTYNFSEKKYRRTGTELKYAHVINENAIFYSKKIPGWKWIIMGVRNFTDSEKNVFQYYENEKNLLRKNPQLYNHDNLPEYIALVMEIHGLRRKAFIDLKMTNDIQKFDWTLMLGLHIHHKYYVKGLKAWEYLNESLVTLCHHCHEDLHKSKQIPVHGRDFNFLGYYYTNCIRCHGKGYLSRYHYHKNGICFRCEGAKYEELIN